MLKVIRCIFPITTYEIPNSKMLILWWEDTIEASLKIQLTLEPGKAAVSFLYKIMLASLAYPFLAYAHPIRPTLLPHVQVQYYALPASFVYFWSQPVA